MGSFPSCIMFTRVLPAHAFKLHIFIGGRVDIVGDQAQAGDRHPGAGDTQEAQLPDRHEVGFVIHLLLNLVQQRLPLRAVAFAGLLLEPLIDLGVLEERLHPLDCT